MKKFHFYLSHTEVDDISWGWNLGEQIRNRKVIWNQKQVTEPAIKVTVWLSQKKLKSIVAASIRGHVDLYKHGKRYSAKAILRAVMGCDCCSNVFDIHREFSTRWFARAKVEQI